MNGFVTLNSCRRKIAMIKYRKRKMITMDTRNNEWAQLASEEKKAELYRQQILLLKTLFEHHAMIRQSRNQ